MSFLFDSRWVRAGVCAIGAASAVQAGRAEERPNLLIVLADDLGFSDLGCYGGEARTPHIDALAVQGLRFRNFYNCARCSPTRASLLTGSYSQRVAMDPDSHAHRLRQDNNLTVAELLRDQGYRTYMIGKWHLGNIQEPGFPPWDRGFQHAYVANRQLYWNAGAHTFRSENHEIPERVYGNEPYAFYRTDASGDYAVDFLSHHLAQTDDAPFFMYLAFNAPHFPLEAPAQTAFVSPGAGVPSYLEIYRRGWDVLRQERFDRMRAEGMIHPWHTLPPFGDTPDNDGQIWPVPAWSSIDADRREDLARRMALYAAMIEHMDRAIGRVVDVLRESGELDRTLILILSDNGAVGEGGLYGMTYRVKNHAPLTGQRLDTMGQPGSNEFLYHGGGWANLANAPYRLYKRFKHGGGIRTPLIAHWPNGIKRPGWTDQTGHVMDILPTMAEVLGVAHPGEYGGRTLASWDGESLLPLLRGGPEVSRRIGFEHMTNRGWIDGDWKLVTKYFADTDGSLKVDDIELYDLSEDPAELLNRAADQPERVSAMIRDWNEWAQEVGLSPAVLLDPGKIPSFPPPEDIVLWSGRADELRRYAEIPQWSVPVNIIDPEIMKHGSFSVEMEIKALPSLVRGDPAYAGFGVGLSQQEVSDSTSGDFRTRTADFFVALDATGELTVWRKGQRLNRSSVGASEGRIKAVFSPAGFNAGDRVMVHVYFDGRVVDINADQPNLITRQFSWDHTDANFIGVNTSVSATGRVGAVSVRATRIALRAEDGAIIR